MCVRVCVRACVRACVRFLVVINNVRSVGVMISFEVKGQENDAVLCNQT